MRFGCRSSRRSLTDAEGRRGVTICRAALHGLGILAHSVATHGLCRGGVAVYVGSLAVSSSSQVPSPQVTQGLCRNLLGSPRRSRSRRTRHRHRLAQCCRKFEGQLSAVRARRTRHRYDRPRAAATTAGQVSIVSCAHRRHRRTLPRPQLRGGLGLPGVPKSAVATASTPSHQLAPSSLPSEVKADGSRLRDPFGSTKRVPMS